MSRLRRREEPDAILDAIPPELRDSDARFDWAAAHGIEALELLRAEVRRDSGGLFPMPSPRSRRHRHH